MAHLYLLMMVWVVLQALWPARFVVIELWAAEAFCLTPVIVIVSSSWLVLPMLEMPKHVVSEKGK
jgi:hypothetical protein